MLNKIRPSYLRAAWKDYKRIGKSKVQSWRKWLTLKKNLKSLVTLLSAGFVAALVVIVYLALQPPKVIILDEAPFKPISVDLSPLEPKHSQLPVAEVKAVTKPVEQPTGDCHTWIKQAGVTDVETAYQLIMKESGCRTEAVNPTSGACGIPQALPCSKLGAARGNPVAEIKWMDNYVKNRYGSWAAAWSFFLANNWY